MASLNQIIDVQITRETRTPSQKGFGTPLLVGDSDRFPAGERIRTYTDIASVEADFTAGDTEIVMARDAFSQNPRPTQIKIGQVEAADADYVAALTAIEAVDSDWYGLAIEDRTAAVISAVAAWAEARIILFAAVNGDADVKAKTSGNILETLKAAAYDRTIYQFSEDTDNHAAVALLAKQLPKLPGSTNWAYQTLAGITADKLTATEQGNITGENGNIYITLNDINNTQFGKVVSGENIDVIRGADFITARIQERVFFELINSEKIPYTDAGITQIDGNLREVLKIARDVNNILESFTTSVPKKVDISTLDIGNRFLPNVEFTGVLAGAINKTQFRGRLVLSEAQV